MIHFALVVMQVSAIRALAPTIARIDSVAPDLIALGEDSVLKQPVHVTYVVHRALERGYLEIANGPEPQRIALSDVSVGTHAVLIPAGTPLADPDGPTVDCHLPPPVVGNGITVQVQALFAPATFGAPVYEYRPGPVARDYGDPPSDDAAAFRGDDRGITAYRIPGPRNVERRRRLEPPVIQVRGVGFRKGDIVVCTRGMRRPQTASTRMRRVTVISTASHQSNDRMPALLAGTIPVPRGIASEPNALTLVGVPRQ